MPIAEGYPRALSSPLPPTGGRGISLLYGTYIKESPVRRKHSRGRDQRSVDLDRHVLTFNPRSRCGLSLRDVLAGVLVLGDTGSAKTTAVLYPLILALMALSSGLLITAAKPDDATKSIRLAKLANRSDVTVFRLGDAGFNPLLHEQQTGSGFPGFIERLVDLSMSPLRQQAIGGSSDPFWLSQSVNVCRSILTLLVHAGVDLSFRLVNEAIMSLPESQDDADDARWRARSPLIRAIQLIASRSLPPMIERDVEQAARHLLVDFPSMPANTRGSIQASATTAFGPLLTGEIGRTLNAEVNTWVPEIVSERNGITIMDCSVLAYGSAAAMVQRFAVDALQNVIKRRVVGPLTRPTFSIIDEYAILGDAEKDAKFMAVSRSQLAGTILAAQNIGGLHATSHAARDPRAAGEMIVATPAVKIFTASSCPHTMQHASRVFTQVEQVRASFGSSRDESGGVAPKQSGSRQNQNLNISRDFQDDVRAIDLLSLKRGGIENKFRAEALVGVSGRIWKSSGRPSIKVSLPQVLI